MRRSGMLGLIGLVLAGCGQPVLTVATAVPQLAMSAGRSSRVSLETEGMQEAISVDRNGNGALERSEIKAVFTGQQGQWYQYLLDQARRDRFKPTVSFEEYTNFCVARKLFAKTDHEAFLAKVTVQHRRLDRNRDDLVSITEFASATAKLTALDSSLYRDLFDKFKSYTEGPGAKGNRLPNELDLAELMDVATWGTVISGNPPAFF